VCCFLVRVGKDGTHSTSSPVSTCSKAEQNYCSSLQGYQSHEPLAKEWALSYNTHRLCIPFSLCSYTPHIAQRLSYPSLVPRPTPFLLFGLHWQQYTWAEECVSLHEHFTSHFHFCVLLSTQTKEQKRDRPVHGNEASNLVPRPPRPAFVACSTKSEGRTGRIYHVMCAAADVMFSLLMSGFVLSPSLFFPWIQFILLLLDRSWLATVHDVSCGMHHVINPSRPSPAFRTASDKSWAWRPGSAAMRLVHCCIGAKHIK